MSNTTLTTAGMEMPPRENADSVKSSGDIFYELYEKQTTLVRQLRCLDRACSHIPEGAQRLDISTDVVRILIVSAERKQVTCIHESILNAIGYFATFRDSLDASISAEIMDYIADLGHCYDAVQFIEKEKAKSKSTTCKELLIQIDLTLPPNEGLTTLLGASGRWLPNAQAITKKVNYKSAETFKIITDAIFHPSNEFVLDFTAAPTLSVELSNFIVARVARSDMLAAAKIHIGQNIVNIIATKLTEPFARADCPQILKALALDIRGLISSGSFYGSDGDSLQYLTGVLNSILSGSDLLREEKYLPQPISIPHFSRIRSLLLPIVNKSMRQRLIKQLDRTAEMNIETHDLLGQNTNEIIEVVNEAQQVIRRELPTWYDPTLNDFFK
ncbi:hypothetical protein HDU93_001105 [Gonapodya sp. JEL0774]|nr:hypothetical protein HDU93_001105 [Gonapodya sp. JEL0774]